MSNDLSVAKESCGLHFLPLLSPAIRSDQPCEVDQSLLNKRMLVAFATGVAFFLAAAYVPMLTLACGITGIVVCLTPLLDRYLTNRALDWNVAVCFHKEAVPSREARNHLLHSTRAVNYLIGMKGDLNKKDTEGKRILDDVSAAAQNAEVRKLLRKNGYVLKELTPSSLSPKEQVELWLGADSEKALLQLKDRGFDPNVVNPTTGLTAIETVVKREFKDPYNTRELDCVRRCRIMVQCGANGQVLVEPKGDQPIPLLAYASGEYYKRPEANIAESLLQSDCIDLTQISELGKQQIIMKFGDNEHAPRIVHLFSSHGLDVNAPTGNGKTLLKNTYILMMKKRALSSDTKDLMATIQALQNVGAKITVNELKKLFSLNNLKLMSILSDLLVFLSAQGLTASCYSEEEQFQILNNLFSFPMRGDVHRAVRVFGLDVNLHSPETGQTFLHQRALRLRGKDSLDELDGRCIRTLLKLGARSKEEVEDEASSNRSGNVTITDVRTIEEICPAIAALRREIADSQAV